MTGARVRIGTATSITEEGDLAAAEAADAAAQGLGDTSCRLAILFASPAHDAALASAAASVRARLDPDVLLGAIAQGVVGPDPDEGASGASPVEFEEGPAVSVWAAGFDGAGNIEGFRTEAMRHGDHAAVVGWPDTETGDVVVLLADPHSYPAGQVVAHLGAERPGHPVVGGMLAGGAGAGRLVLATRDDDQPRDHTDGAVGVALRGVPVEPVVSQGCRPVGEPFVVTRSERNVIYELAGEPATEQLREMFAEVSDTDRELMQRGLQVGLVADEYRDEFDTGDFLIRGVLGADEDEGAIAIGEPVAVGQTVQFQVRDATSAHDDLKRRLDVAGQVGQDVAGALLFTCNGRGQRFFHERDHDARLIGDTLTGRLAGAFCAGEIGPVGERSFLHGYTASLAIFRAA